MFFLISKINRAVKIIALSLFVLFPLIITPAYVYAAATPAGTEISNIAKINYEIIGFPQPEMNTPASKFLVDRKLDVNVSESNGTRTAVAPGDQKPLISALVLM